MNLNPFTLTLTLDGLTLSPKEVNDWARHKLTLAKHDWEIHLATFLLNWYDSSLPKLAVQTSGSSGTPRTLHFSREALLESALRTCRFFGLKEDMTALLCLNTNFIAGKMMVVRALAGRLNLVVVPPVSSPLENIQTPPDFVAMVPAQIVASLAHPASERILLNTKTILIGGAPLPSAVEDRLAELKINAWITYGMTETLTHVAIRKAGERPPAFRPLEGISFKTADDGTLCIEAPFLEKEIKTNDLVKLLPDCRFILKGRADFVINSGGIKIFPEQLEQQLAPFFHRPFFITSHPHPVLGEVPLLVAEASLLIPKDIEALCRFISAVLPRHLRPTALKPVSKIHLSDGGKILRQQTLQAPENKNSPILELKYS